MKKFHLYFVLTLVWFVAFYFVFSGFAYRADFKIGYIHSGKIFDQHQETVEAQKKIEAEQQQLQKEYQARQEALQKKVKQFETQSLMLSDTKKAEFQKELQDMQVDILNFEQINFAPGGSLEKKWQEMMKPIVDKVQIAIDRIGTEEGFDIIFDTKNGFILYAKDDYDLTNRVLEELNKQ